jgi:hypothetical protein
MIAASDYGRPYVRFSINDIEPGQESSVVTVSDETSLRRIEIFLAQDGSPIAGYKHAAVPWSSSPSWDTVIQVFKNGDLWAEVPVDSPLAKMSLNDTESITGTSYDDYIERDGDWYINNHSLTAVNPSTLNTGGEDYYFVRIIQDGMRITAIGPIWVKAQA